MRKLYRTTVLVGLLSLVACGSDELLWNAGMGGKAETNPGLPIQMGSLIVRESETTRQDHSLGVRATRYGGWGRCGDIHPYYENGSFHVVRLNSGKPYQTVLAEGEVKSKYELDVTHHFPVGEYQLILNNTVLVVNLELSETVEVFAGRIEIVEGTTFTVTSKNRMCDDKRLLHVPHAYGINVLPADLDPNKPTTFYRTIYGDVEQLLAEDEVLLANKP